MFLLKISVAILVILIAAPLNGEEDRKSRISRPSLLSRKELEEEEDQVASSSNRVRSIDRDRPKFVASDNPEIVLPEKTGRQRFTPSRGGSRRGSLSSQNSLDSGGSSNSIRTGSDDYKIVCYYTNWSQYRPKIGKYLPEDIDPFLCTHIIFAFGWMKNGRMSSFEANDESIDGKIGLYERVTSLRKANPKLKVLIAIGGWSFGTAKFKEMAASRFSRQMFILSSIDFLRKNEFDGLDVDWEYPKRTDKENYVLFLKELKESFELEALETDQPRLILSAAVPVGPDNVRGGYDVAKVGKYLDIINVMAYDFHGKWEQQAGHNAPLFAPSSDSEWRKQLSVDFASKMWERLGAPKEKLVIGMPTYGRSFTLKDRRKYSVNSPSKDGGKAGEYTREAGFLSYYEICQLLQNGATYIWDEEMKVPYLVDGDQWVGFDDERSIRNKMNWLKKRGYAGAMVWTLDMDDFNGTVCGGGVKYPLIGAMREELSGVPREVSIPGGGSDVDWSKVARSQVALATTFAPPQRINVKDLLAQARKPVRKTTSLLLPLNSGSDLPANQRKPQVFCYFTNWSYKRPGMGKFTPEDIDPFLCTHIVFAFSTIKEQKLAPSEDTDIGDAYTDGNYERIMKLKEKNPELNVLLAVGGWAFGSTPFRELTLNIFRQNRFVYDSIEFLRRHNFDGLDIDWEYPRGADDRAAFVNLIKELRLAFEGEHKSAKKPKLLLTAAVPASFEAIAAGYDVPELAKYLDFINVMTYDFHGQWERQVGHNSPLFPLNSASSFQKKLTVDYSAKEWVRQGAPPEKLIIGMPTYGRTFTLVDKAKFDVGAAATGGGEPGKYTGEAGFLSYYEICDFLHKDNTTLVWDNEQQVPFAYRDDQWVGFDDERSLRTKIQWLEEEGYGGIMVWSIDLDDFRGYCGTGKYPLINAMKKEMEDYKVNLVYEGPYETPRPGSKSKKVSTELECVEEDGHVSFHRDPSECGMYYVCQGKHKHHKPCPTGLVFNEDESVCDWPDNVEQCVHLSTTRK